MGSEHDSRELADNPVGSGEKSGNNDGMENDLSELSEDSSDMDSDSDSDVSSDEGKNEDLGGDNSSQKGKEDNGKKEEEELDEEDPVIKAIMKAKEKKSSNHPPDIVLDAIPSTMCFHPMNDQIAFGNYEGQILLYGYSLEENIKLVECVHKDSSVRAISFTHDGEKLISAFSDQAVKFYDVGAGLKLDRTIKNATSAAVSSLYVVDENVFAIGDDDGNVLLWDKRSKNAASNSLRLGEDAITSMVTNDAKRILVCTSEEGAIYAVKIRGGKVQVESEIYDYEFNCSCVFKQESKVAVGDGKGDVYIFNWDEFGKHSDICTGIGRGEAINAMIPITEKIILCAGDDGFIRAFNFFPQKYLGVVGKLSHIVEKMDVCNDGHLIASSGADETVKFWNVSYFENMTVTTAGSAGKDNKKVAVNKSTKTGGQQQDLSKRNLPSSSHQNTTDFFKGLAE